LTKKAPPAPLSQTAQALSIANFGAILKDAIIGNLDAIQHCINAAQTQGKSVWISYLQVLRGNTASRIRIEGARTWYNIVYYKV
jgi:hypothetical protein